MYTLFLLIQYHIVFCILFVLIKISCVSLTVFLILRIYIDNATGQNWSRSEYFQWTASYLQELWWSHHIHPSYLLDSNKNMLHQGFLYNTNTNTNINTQSSSSNNSNKDSVANNGNIDLFLKVLTTVFEYNIEVCF